MALPRESGERMAWISVYQEVDGPKLRRLARLLKSSKAEALGILNYLWFWGMNNADETGKILEAGHEDIAAAIAGATKIHADFVVEALFEAGWLDMNGDDIFLHDWDTWQEQWYKLQRTRKNDAERKRKAYQAEKQAKAMFLEKQQTIPLPEETTPVLIPKSDIKNITEEQFEEFWKAYPRKSGKGNARKAWAKISPSKALFQKIMTALESAKRCEQWKREKGQFIPYPATWLNGERWEDDYGTQDTANPENEASSEFDSNDPYTDWGDEP